MVDFDAANKIRDRRLRRRLLGTLHLVRGDSPTGGIGGQRLMDLCNDPVSASSQVFEDEAHFMRLMRDLLAKQLVEEKNHQRRRGQRFGPEFVSFKITDKGSRLCLETIPPDPDIDDDRIAADAEGDR